ncbi:MAG: SDR family NAD(P)-dependent oxidoreductase [Hyphomicrobiaceae bacterium]
MTNDFPVAIVTGGNRGMGLETCRQLGALGYHVVLLARDRDLGERAAQSLRAEGHAIEAFKCDLTRTDDIALFLSHLNRRGTRVDVLVNNAGQYLEYAGRDVDQRVSALTAQTSVVRAILDSNLLGPFTLTQGILQIMKRQAYGRVVSLSSAMGQLSDMGGGAPGYRLACVGISAMTKFFAEELKGTDVLINCVDPGWVRTHSPEATRSIEDGVVTTIWLATLPTGGPTGQFFRDKTPIPW